MLLLGLTALVIVVGDAIVAVVVGRPYVVAFAAAPAAVAVTVGIVVGRRLNRRDTPPVTPMECSR
jgi:hypothetical protein